MRRGIKRRSKQVRRKGRGIRPRGIDVQIFRRDENDVTHFLTVTRWESEEAVRSFAGSSILKAKYYPEDRCFIEFSVEVGHTDHSFPIQKCVAHGYHGMG